MTPQPFAGSLASPRIGGRRAQPDASRAPRPAPRAPGRHGFSPSSEPRAQRLRAGEVAPIRRTAALELARDGVWTVVGCRMDRSYLVLDIETIIDPELPIPSESSQVERLPAPPHHQVVCIGVMWFDRNYSVVRMGIIGEGKGEAEALTDFTRFADERQPDLITFNGRGFDLPVLASRCLRHGIPFRYYYQSRDVRYRFSPDGHLDLMDFLADFGATRQSRLDVIAKLCGMPGKVGVDGKDVGPMVHAGQLDQVRNYCLCDVVQTAGVFLRVQLLRGELTPQAYREAVDGLINFVKAEPRVAPVAASWNEARLRLAAS